MLNQPIATLLRDFALLHVPVHVSAMCSFRQLVHSFLQSFVEENVTISSWSSRRLGLVDLVLDLLIHFFEVNQIEQDIIVLRYWVVKARLLLLIEMVIGLGNGLGTRSL